MPIRSGRVKQPGTRLPHGSQPLTDKGLLLRLCRHHAVGENNVVVGLVKEAQLRVS